MYRKDDEAPSGFHELVDTIYSAALEPPLWSLFIRQLCEMTQSNVGVLMNLRGDKGFGGSECYLHNTSQEWFSRYEEHYFQYDYIASKLQQSPVGTIVQGSAEISKHDFIRSEFYTDFLAPQQMFYTLNASIAKTRESRFVFGVSRQRYANDFDRTDVAFIKALIPHLRRAYDVSQRLNVRDEKARIGELALERVNAAVFIVDYEGRVLQMNRRAEKLLALRSGLFYRNERIRSSRVEETEHLQKLIREASQYLDHRDRSTGVMTLVRTPPLTQLNILVTPVKTQQTELSLGVSRANAMVFITERGQEVGFSHEEVSALYGLSKAEARVAVGIADGLGIEQIAEKYHVGVETVRSQLNAVFRKMGVGRQAELVKEMLTGPLNFSR